MSLKLRYDEEADVALRCGPGEPRNAVSPTHNRLLVKLSGNSEPR